MASRHCASSLRGPRLVLRSPKLTHVQSEISRLPCTRSMATAVSSATSSSTTLPTPPEPSASRHRGLIVPNKIPSHILANPDVLTTVYSFPKLEPLRFEYYPHTHLAVPLRRDLLHKAVVFEGDNTRHGTANTKHRGEVHGSGRKLRPQKGTGRARLGDRKSPMLKGGGVAHGPKPRDFGTDLPKKMYHKAWRMALSYRYKRGQLVVVDKLRVPTDMNKESREYWMRWALDGLGWGKSAGGHSFFIASEESAFSETLEQCHRYGRVRTVKDVDVKNLLEMKRLVVERKALQRILREHQSDLKLPLLGSAFNLTKSAAGANIPRAVREVSEAEMANAMAEARAQSSLENPMDGFASTIAAAGAASALSSATSGMNSLSMDEADRLVAEAEDVVDEDAEFDEEEEFDEDEEFDETDFEEDPEDNPRR